MKVKMDEIDEIWVIYKRNLGQNIRWNINLSLKINFGRWIKKLGAIGPLDRHITIRIISRPLDQHGRDLGHQITLHEGGEISPKNQRYISDISPTYHRYFATRGDFFKKSPIYLPEPIYRRYFGDIYGNISSRFFSMKYRVDPSRYTIYRRYITDISRYFPPWM